MRTKARVTIINASSEQAPSSHPSRCALMRVDMRAVSRFGHPPVFLPREWRDRRTPTHPPASWRQLHTRPGPCNPFLPMGNMCGHQPGAEVWKALWLSASNGQGQGSSSSRKSDLRLGYIWICSSNPSPKSTTACESTRGEPKAHRPLPCGFLEPNHPSC